MFPVHDIHEWWHIRQVCAGAVNTTVSPKDGDVLIVWIILFWIYIEWTPFICIIVFNCTDTKGYQC